MVSKTTTGRLTGGDANVQANNSTGRRNSRVGQSATTIASADGATDTDVNVLTARDGSGAEAAEATPTDVAPAPEGKKMVRRQITAPGRLAKIREGFDNGKPVKNVMVTRRAGKITAYEMVEDKG